MSETKHTEGKLPNKLVYDGDFILAVDWTYGHSSVVAGPVGNSGVKSAMVDRYNCHKALLAACKEFVRKCECGEARSVKSYAQMKAAIADAEPGECKRTGGE